MNLPLILALALSLQQGPIPSVGERTAGWLYDLDAWLAALEREHYVFRERGLSDELLAAADGLRAHVEHYSDQRMLLEFQRLACLAGDGHTYVLPFAPRVEAAFLPLRFHFFADGLFVVDADAPLERCIGACVLALGDEPVEELESRLAAHVSRDNEHGIRWVGPLLLRAAGWLEAEANVKGATIPVRLRQMDGAEEVLALTARPEPPMAGIPKLAPSRLPGAPPPPLYLKDVGRAHWFEWLGDGSLYVQFNQVMDGPGQTIAQFAARLAQALDEHDPSQLVVDVRHNNGGNSGLLAPLLDQLKRFEREHPEGRLVVLMGRNTFSAAQIFLGQVDRETRAVFAGEPSSSRPNFVGEENEFVLPWSGALTSISNRYHETIPGDTRAFIEPRSFAREHPRALIPGRRRRARRHDEDAHAGLPGRGPSCSG
jgi:hypothetical protein